MLSGSQMAISKESSKHDSFLVIIGFRTRLLAEYMIVRVTGQGLRLLAGWSTPYASLLARCPMAQAN